MRLFLIVPLLAAAPLSAEVKSVTDYGFEVAKTVVVKGDPAKVYSTIGQPGLWWNPAHSYSQDAKNMTMLLRPGGCFCEALPKEKGAVEHGRVVFAQPGKVVRISAALGPLGAEGVSGTLTFQLKAVDGGTQVAMNYVVGGYIRGGGPKQWAPAVDFVLSEQVDRLKAYLDGH